jgi:RNA-binding protein NOB1
LGSGLTTDNNKNSGQEQEVVDTTKNDQEGIEEGNNDSSGNSDNENEEDDDDESGWITPSNYKQKIKDLQSENGEFQDPDEASKVACLTNDFSMQNLMLHVGIKVLSSNGMLIKQLRTYILRCYTCFQTTSKMDKLFCPKCGHKTLKRVSVTVNPEDGSQVIHLSRRVNLTGKGKKYPLPMPKGGKHSNNPILTEDQPIPQQRASKQAMQRNNPLLDCDSDYVAGMQIILFFLLKNAFMLF